MIINISTLSAETALRVLDAAFKSATDQKIEVAVCISDSVGNVVVAARMDVVAPSMLEFAADKAYTSVMMRQPTEAYAELMASKQSLTLGLSTRERLLPWGGGLPIVFNHTIVGALGVSGGKEYEDVSCAEMALAATGLGWKL